MPKFLIRSALAAASALFLAPAQAALVWGPTTSYVNVFSQLGPVTLPSNWITTPNTGGITAAGIFSVQVPAGQVAGHLLHITIDRPFSITVTPTALISTVDVDGYSTPPTLGVAGNTSGSAYTMVTETTTPFLSFPHAHPVVAGTTAAYPMTLVAGSATWLSAPVSVTTPLLPVGNYYLRQVFDLDGVYLSGPGGTWSVDLPLVSTLNAVPEPSTYALLALGLVGVAWVRRSRKS